MLAIDFVYRLADIYRFLALFSVFNVLPIPLCVCVPQFRLCVKRDDVPSISSHSPFYDRWIDCLRCFSRFFVKMKLFNFCSFFSCFSCFLFSSFASVLSLSSPFLFIVHFFVKRFFFFFFHFAK